MDAAEAVYQAVMDAYEKGRREAIQECHDAVAALLGKTVPPSDGVTEALAAIDGLQTSLSGPAAVLSSEPEPPTSVAPAGEGHGAPADPPFRFSRSVECIHQFKTFDQIDGGKHAKCVLCGFKEPAAHVKPIYVDAWDGMAVPYGDHVVAVRAAHAAGMREALADFLTSIDEDDPVYLRGHSVGVRDGIQIGRVMAACDIEQLGVWAVNPNSYIRLTDGTRLVRLNDAVKAARGDIDA